MTVRLLYLVSHPIQYQAPLLREIARDPDIDLRVLFERLDSSSSYFDPGFARTVSWDVPLLEGYDFDCLKEKSLSQALSACDVLWLHGWQSRTARRALRLAGRRGIPLLMRAENWEIPMPDGSGLRGILKKKFLQWVFKHCCAFLSIGSRNRLYYENHGIPADRIFSMPYGVDNDFFAARAGEAGEKEGALRRELGIAANQPVILFIGKLTERKHPEHALEAWKKLRDDVHRDRTTPEPSILFVGDGPLAPSLRRQAESHESVKLVGFRNQTELPAFYRLADVVVVPSEREPWGLVVNEAMACGAAVVATDHVGAAHDLIGLETEPDSPGASGLMVPFGDIAALTKALTAVLRRADEMGDAARFRVAGHGLDAQVAGLKSAVSWVLHNGESRVAS